MKKALCTLAVLFCLTCLVSCGNSSESSNSEATTTSTTATTTAASTENTTTATPKVTTTAETTTTFENTTESDIDVIDPNDINVKTDKETVSITIPAEYVDPEMINDDDFRDIKTNDDGSVTFVVTREEHQKLISELQTVIDDFLREYADSHSSVNSISHNSSYTEFTVDTTSREAFIDDSTFGFDFLIEIYSAYYSAYCGNEVVEPVIRYIDSSTGSEFSIE